MPGSSLLPTVEQVRPGLWSIPVPIPHSRLAYTLCYALELSGDGVALIDAGWDSADGWNQLLAGLQGMGSDIKDVHSVLVTHVHPDHYGLAGQVREASGAWIGLHPADIEVLEERDYDAEVKHGINREFLEEVGAPADDILVIEEASLSFNPKPSAMPDIQLQDGFSPELPGWDLKTIWTPGHSPGHVCFFDSNENVLFSGDHILPKITPNISLMKIGPFNPLHDYLISLDRLALLDAQEVLPAHQYRFAGLLARIEELRSHHGDRLSEVEAIVQSLPRSTSWAIAEAMSWSSSWSELSSLARRHATREALAHLFFLEHEKRVTCVGRSPLRWVPAADSDSASGFVTP